MSLVARLSSLSTSPRTRRRDDGGGGGAHHSPNNGRARARARLASSVRSCASDGDGGGGGGDDAPPHDHHRTLHRSRRRRHRCRTSHRRHQRSHRSRNGRARALVTSPVVARGLSDRDGGGVIVSSPPPSRRRRLGGLYLKRGSDQQAMEVKPQRSRGVAVARVGWVGATRQPGEPRHRAQGTQQGCVWISNRASDKWLGPGNSGPGERGEGMWRPGSGPEWWGGCVGSVRALGEGQTRATVSWHGSAPRRRPRNAPERRAREGRKAAEGSGRCPDL